MAGRAFLDTIVLVGAMVGAALVKTAGRALPRLTVALTHLRLVLAAMDLHP